MKIQTPPTAHADYVYKKPNTYGNPADVMFEAKARKLAVKMNFGRDKQR